MTTTEKLFVQIFEKKKSIIEQVKHQAELFNQHLASKLLIDGITPPSWLWNPSSHSRSSDSKELNKEELISKLLLQHQRHSAPYISGHCTAYDKPDVSGDTVRLTGGLSVDTHASNKHQDARNESVTVLQSRDNNVRCALDGVPEADFSVNSPQDETDVRISNIYTAPDQSLARIQRSKSRQKALELRTSAKAANKSCLSHENGAEICFSQNSFPRIDFQQADQDSGSSKLAKHSDISRKSIGFEDAKEGSHSDGFSRSKYSGESTKSKHSYRHPTNVAEFLQGGGYSELAKEDSGKQLQSLDNSFRISNCDSEQMKMVDPSGATFENHEVREATIGKCSAKHQDSNIYCGRITRSRSSSIPNRSIDESSKPGTSSYTAKAGRSTLAQSMCKSAKQLEHFDKLQEAVKPSGELTGREIRSQSTCCAEDTLIPVNSSYVAAYRVTRSRSGATKEFPLVNPISEHESNVLSNVSGCQLIPLCPSSDVNQGVAEVVAKTQLADGQVEVQPLYLQSNLDDAGLRKDSEMLVSSQPTNCYMVVRPKQLDFGDIEECNRSSNKIYSALLDEVSPDNPIENFLEEQSQMGRNVSTKPEESQTDANVVEPAEDEECRFGSETKMTDMLEIVECNLEAASHAQNSFLLHEADVAPSDTPYHSDKEMHLETCEVSRENCSPFKLQIEEDENDNHGEESSASMSKISKPSFISGLFKRIENFQNCLDKQVVVPQPTSVNAETLLDGQDRQDVLHVENANVCHERVLVGNGTDLGEDGSAHGSVGQQHVENNCVGCVDQAEYQLKKSTTSPMTGKNPSNVNLLPQSKRRKIDDQKLNRLSASPSFMGQTPHDLQRDNIHGLLEKSEIFLDSVQELQVCVSEVGNLSQPNANKSSDSVKEFTTDEFGFSPRLRIEEDEVGSKVDYMTVESPFTFKDKQMGPSCFPSLTKKVAEGVTDSLVEDVEIAPSTIFDASNVDLGHKVSMVNTDNLNAEINFSKRISHLTENGLLSYFSGGSPHTDQNSVGPDETMPVEGFILIDGQTEIEELDNAGERVNLSISTLDLPSSNLEQGSILEQICRSASMQTPSSDFSSKFKLHKVHNLYQSVPNGLLEGVDMKSTVPLDMDAGKLLRASYGCVDEVKSSIYGVPYSDSFSYSGTRVGWNSKNQYASPVGKLWGRFSSGSSTSEKRLTSNPELTCYPIEEDPCTSEENENVEEAEEMEQGIGSRLINESAKEEALAEKSEACFNSQTLISAAEKVPDRGSLDSAGTEFSFHETYTRGKQKLRNRRSSKKSANEGKENKTSLGTFSIKQGNKPLHSRYNKPKLSGNTSLRNRVQRLSQKEPKHNNIASGITSFIPLVQQKQAAAACPGKRDIKVKALEAAEAAKRLEEKRENERKMKKEALKLERARIEKENMREMQLNKKKKQEEQKKREADIAARKRLREEEETKEKERKRKRVVDGRREQKLPEEKFRIGKVEKDRHGEMNEKMNPGKVSEYPLNKKKKNVENEGRDENNLEKYYIVPESCTLLEDLDASSDRDNNGKVTTILEKSARKNNSGIMISRETSYDISPYQSCDEEEDEDDKPTTKIFPSWTSEALVLPLLEKHDPAVVFPPGVSSRIDEVIQPRRLRVK